MLRLSGRPSQDNFLKNFYLRKVSRQALLRDSATPHFSVGNGAKSKGRVAQIGLTGKKKVPKLGEMC